jgi:sulfur-oxidizing protein SoxX
MKALTAASLALIASASLVAAAEVAPDAVEFDDYGAIALPVSATPGDPVAGANVLSSRSLGNCVACHAVSAMPDVDFQGDVGPSLDGVAERWDEAQLRGIIANAKQVFPDTVMPSFYKTSGFIRPGDGYTGKAAEGELAPLLTAQQIEDVVAYLQTLN